ncbi:hypothetical protein [Nocardia sp. CA-135398]|uniref:hypothetical protein n=1 Tax=Nocardia sp. CA-135398 TaxID=3239977 RepID=UPI003D955BDD
MWGWSSRVAEHASATTWTSWQTVETEPTVVDPQDWGRQSAEPTGWVNTGAEVEAESDDGMSVAVPIREYDLVG